MRLQRRLSWPAGQRARRLAMSMLKSSTGRRAGPGRCGLAGAGPIKLQPSSRRLVEPGRRDVSAVGIKFAGPFQTALGLSCERLIQARLITFSRLFSSRPRPKRPADFPAVKSRRPALCNPPNFCGVCPALRRPLRIGVMRALDHARCMLLVLDRFGLILLELKLLS